MPQKAELVEENQKKAQEISSYKYMGSPIKMREDLIPLQGKGQYLDDIELPGTLYMAYALSPFGHALIRSIDTSQCLELPGVKYVLTGDELREHTSPFMQITEPPSGNLQDYPLAVDRVRYYGEPVVAVVATDPYIAEDAAELIKVEYEPLPVVLDAEEALKEGAQILHPSSGTNLVWRGVWDLGDIQKALKEADYVVEDTVITHRYAAVPLETSAVLASYDHSVDVITVYSVNQMPMFSLPIICGALRMPTSKFRMILPPNIGGAFGGKIINYTHITVVAYLSRLLQAPVKYVETRSENIMSGTHNNERAFHVKLAVKKDGRVTGAYMTAYDNCGAYPRYEPAGAVIWAQVVPGIYDVQNVYVDFNQVTTNKGPTGPVRGYSRIQHNFMWERMMNRVAQKLKMDPAEVRRKNLIKVEQMPYIGPSKTIYDGGDYHKAFDKLLETIEYRKWREEQKKSRAKGRLIGIGLSAVIDSGANNFGQVKIINKNFPASGSVEVGLVMIDQFGSIVARTGTSDQGQSHATTFSQIVAETFNTDPDKVVFQQGFDSISNVWAAFSGAYASRSAVMAGTALHYASLRLKEKILTIAAHAMGEQESNLEVKDASVVSMKTNKKMSFGDIAMLAWLDVNKLPEDLEPGLISYAVYKPDFTYNMPDEKKRINNTLTYSYSMHGTVIEVDPETFEMKILKHGVVSDPGLMINPMVVEGQEMGATMHGISAALMENLVYDDDGILLTSNFWDYLVAGARQMPEIDLKTIVTRSTSSVLGVRGIGEGGGGPIGSIVNAVEDALEPLGIKLLSSSLSANELYSLSRKK